MLRAESVRLTVVPRELLEALAAEVPAKDAMPSHSLRGDDGNGNYSSRLLVDRWLRDRGIVFRVKAEPDGKGRTIYVLQQCPFDPSHTDPDACIMQDTHGKMSAQCFHNSCKGRGWQQFKETIGAPQRHHYDPPLSITSTRKHSILRRHQTKDDRDCANDISLALSSAPPLETENHSIGLPTIQGNQRQLRDVTDDALKALLARNHPPTLFQRGGVLTRLRVGADNAVPLLEPLTDSALRGVLARAANWLKARSTKGGTVLEDDAPPLEVVKDLATLPDWPDVPVLEAVVETPVFMRQGELLRNPGFHADARLWYHPAANLFVPDVPSTPSAADSERARHLLMTELLGDFPFGDEASRAHALAALLLPFVRPLIDGPTPLHLFDAPVEGTGKTLLASCLSEVCTGRPVEALAEASDDEEWRKRITAVLIEGPTIVLLDNLNRILDSGALASVLTSRVWKDRVLGVSKTVRVPNLAVWLASGNNTRLSRELIRRTVWCRLDSRTDAPWERTGFRHKNLLRWVQEHRGELVWAALVLCQAWIAEGRPPGEQTLGMFESWAETLGGILQVAGVSGLLANAMTFRQQAADTSGEWRAFVAAWWTRFGGEAVGVKDLFQLVTEEKLLDAVLGDKGEVSQRIRLGRALGKARDRVVGEYRILGGEEDHSCRQTYRLQQVASCVPSAETAGDTFELCG
jgi:putative DNA primase/helicase